MSFSLLSCSCTKKSTDIIAIKTDISLGSVRISNQDFQEINNYTDYNNIECPYNELFDMDTAIVEKSFYSFSVEQHNYDFLNGTNIVDADKLYSVVKENNKKYMDGIGGNFNKKLSDSKLKESCEYIAKTLNWGIENISGLNLKELSCILGGLKIVKVDSLNSVGSYSDKQMILKLDPDAIKTKGKSNNIDNMFELTVCHEAMHILQSHCLDIEQLNDDSFIATSYSFENLNINPLKHSWLYEGSAELCATQMLNMTPTTYQYMIDNIETINLATLISDNQGAGRLEQVALTNDTETLYSLFDFNDSKKAMEFLYTVELLREQPKDFEMAYKNTYGDFEQGYEEFLKLTYNPYFVEVTSKLLYKNLAYKLTKNEISLNDVFYIISIYEMDLLKDIPLDNETVREKYQTTYDNYVELQNKLFKTLQQYTEMNICDEFVKYEVDYGDKLKYINADLKWLDDNKKTYLFNRNYALYKSDYKKVRTYTN